MITKIKVSFTPQLKHNYQAEIDLANGSIYYSQVAKNLTQFKKLTQTQVQQINELIEPMRQLKQNNYSGPIIMNGFFWEFDLINDYNKKMEIEGINTIDHSVVQLICQLESIIGFELGCQQFKELIK